MQWETSWPDPCPSCERTTTHTLDPLTQDGVLFTQRTCPECRHRWMEAAPSDLGPDDIVRAYDRGETTVDFVADVSGDDVEVAGRLLQRWQVVIY